MATEKRLIDADDALEQLKQAEKEMKVVTPLGCKAVDIKVVLKYIESRPTVDAVEVVHGRWVLAKPRVKGRNATYRCTACGKLRSSYYNDVYQWEYCPCGAKMDGDGNG